MGPAFGRLMPGVGVAVPRAHLVARSPPGAGATLPQALAQAPFLLFLAGQATPQPQPLPSSLPQHSLPPLMAKPFLALPWLRCPPQLWGPPSQGQAARHLGPLLAAAIDEDVLRYQFVKKKGYVRLHTSHGDLNLELHCDLVGARPSSYSLRGP